MLISGVMEHLHNSSLIQPIKVSSAGWGSFSASQFLHLTKQIRVPKVVRWTLPRQCAFKLNVDGSSLDNPGFAGSGVVLHDYDSHVIFAKSTFFGIGTSFFAEIMVLFRGLCLCQEWNFGPLLIESDSHTLVRCLLMTC